jgi:hypothetical protein
MNEGTGAGAYGHGMRHRCSFSLGRYAMVFQAEVYAIKACTDEDIKGAIVIGTFILSQTVKLQSKHLTIVKSTPNWSGTDINP